MAGMTRTEYARHRGVSPPMVTKLVAVGKIVVGDNGLIDAAAADAMIAHNRQRIDGDAGDNGGDAEQNSPVGSLTAWKTRTEQFRAKTAKLDYESRIGSLVDVAEIERAVVICAGALGQLLDMPLNRVDVIMAAAGKSPGDLRAALKQLIGDQRQRASDEFAKLAAAAATSSARAADDTADGADDSDNSNTAPACADSNTAINPMDAHGRQPVSAASCC